MLVAEGLGTQHIDHRINFISSKENLEKTVEFFCVCVCFVAVFGFAFGVFFC